MDKCQEFLAIKEGIKRFLKQRQITYADLASRLGVAEITVKRFLTGEDGSVSRIASICEVLEVSFFDLMALVDAKQDRSFVLTSEQEERFVGRFGHYLFFSALLKYDLPRIKQDHDLDDKSVFRYLKDLDDWGLLELGAGNAYRMLYRGTHSWLDHGPLQQSYIAADCREFVTELTENFDREDYYFTSSDRLIHRETYRRFLHDCSELAKEYRKKAYQDEVFYDKKDLILVKWILGSGPKRPARIPRLNSVGTH